MRTIINIAHRVLSYIRWINFELALWINFELGETQFPGGVILGGMGVKKHTINHVLFKKK
jgi:hypothetical protein